MILNGSDDVTRELIESGWNTVLNIDLATVLQYMNEQKHDRLETMAFTLAMQLKKLGVSTISFDKRIHNYIKNYVSKKIGDLPIKYYIKNGISPLSQSGFVQSLNKNNVITNKNIKAVSFQYKSEFELQ